MSLGNEATSKHRAGGKARISSHWHTPIQTAHHPPTLLYFRTPVNPCTITDAMHLLNVSFFKFSPSRQRSYCRGVAAFLLVPGILSLKWLIHKWTKAGSPPDALKDNSLHVWAAFSMLCSWTRRRKAFCWQKRVFSLWEGTEKMHCFYLTPNVRTAIAELSTWHPHRENKERYAGHTFFSLSHIQHSHMSLTKTWILNGLWHHHFKKNNNKNPKHSNSLQQMFL